MDVLLSYEDARHTPDQSSPLTLPALMIRDMIHAADSHRLAIEL
jgi:hypothetical protein